ncbi:GH25 family lysozyme [Clostridium thermobutyricum]|uniref:GH25 family lysozyme n=1 Tax=Clostridium thermobutyricum TaxID=29372 RepID=UPI003F51D77A
MLKGIDISKHNGNVNFTEVKKSGVDIVIIKATEGVDYIDPLFEKHYKGASGVGISIGFYHFMSEKTDPSKQAKDFWDAIKNRKFDIVPCLDIESNTLGRNRKQISDRCIEFLEEFKRLSGYDCMIYTGGYFGRDNLDDRVKKYIGWIAHYGVSKPMETGFKVVGHQYSDSGKIEGINSNVDLNNFTNEIFIKNLGDSSNQRPSQKPNIKPKELWEISIQGEEVKALQMELNSQFNAGLKVDGHFGNETLNACITVRIGAKGNLTKLIQKRLINRGYNLSPYGADGNFGSTTEKAIKKLQNVFNLVQDGIVGKNTWKALYGLDKGKF